MNNILYKKENKIAIITISRPKALNALNIETLNELMDIINQIKDDEDIYCVVIRGDGDKAFVAGADIREMKDMDSKKAKDFGTYGNKVFSSLESLPMPIIAVIDGYALGGGCELILSCEIRIAGENASFGMPEVTLGITPGFGATQRLSEIVGISKAKELIYTGKIIKAKEALSIGLVNHVFPSETLWEETIALANKIVLNAPIAIRACKKALNHNILIRIESGLSIETQEFAKCFDSQDQKNAMNAYVEKKKFEYFENK